MRGNPELVRRFLNGFGACLRVRLR